jgi:hypothetical protein
MMTNHTGLEEEIIFRIGAIASIVGSLLAMVGNLLHPATPTSPSLRYGALHPKLNFIELRHGEVLRIYLLGISVNKG